MRFEGILGTSSGFRSAPCVGTSAGTFKITPNALNKSKNIKYLCFGDRLNIVHNKADVLFQDPKPATIPGIGYVFYDCKPSVDGPSLSAVINDACINKKSPIIVNGSPVNQTEGMWLARGAANGDIEFNNDGYLQNAYNNGKPVQFWFAPITLDQFATNPFFEPNASNVSGACIAVNKDSAFSVVYLNALALTNVTAQNNGTNNYTGTFTITGGLPEFDPAANYTRISILNNKDANLIGRLTNGPATNGKPMTFSVPQPGTYDILIEDINGCSITERITIMEDPGLIKLGCMDGNIGQEVCYPISIGRIPDLTAAQFTVGFNPQALEYVGAKNLNPILQTTIDNVIVTNSLAQGFIKFFWVDFNLNSYDFTNESPLVELCFKIKGPPGPNTVRILPNPGPTLPRLELSDADGNSIPLTTATGSVFDCTMNINPSSNLDAYYSQCGQTLFGQVFGGTGPYSTIYKLIANPTVTDTVNFAQATAPMQIFSNLASGAYELIAKDATGSSVIDTFTISSAITDITIDFSNRDNISCKGKDGRILAIASGGTPVYRFEWSTNSVSDRITNLTPGTYTVKITDAQGCVKTDSVTLINEGVQAAYTIDRLPRCSGVNDGRVLANPSGAFPPFLANWEGPGTQIGNSFTSVGELPVRLIINDARGCSDTTAYFTLMPQKRIDLSLTVDNPRCYGNTDGRLRIGRSFSDGSTMTGDQVTLSTPSGSVKTDNLRPAIFNDLQADIFNVRVAESSGCFVDTVINLVQPNPLDTINVVVKPESCFPGKDGQISIPLIGGTGPYRYTWNDIPDDVSTRTGLTSGSYSVNITDANNCVANFDATNLLAFSFTLPTFPVTIDTTKILCFGGTATLTARPITQYSIKSYVWSTGDTLQTAKNVPGNIKTWVNVFDSVGCKGTDTIILSQPQRLSLIDSNIISNLCPGLDQGRINLLADGGTGPYTYTMNNGPTQNFGTYTRLVSGKYTITITDANQCPSLVVNTELIEPPKIVGVFDTTSFRGVKCAGTGDCTGQARLLVSGGTDPQNNFLISWASGEKSLGAVIAVADSLCAGNQSVRITDGNGCSTSLSFNISSPTAIIRDPIRTAVNDIICFGQSNGSVNYIAFGGTSPYKYLWNDSDTNSIRSGLSAGRYAILVTDLNNCSFLDSLVITEPPVLNVTLDSIKTRPITCPGSDDGQVGVKVAGGNAGAIVHTWTPNYPDTNFIRGVVPGVYAVIVSDSKGCKDTLNNITMAAPPDITANLAVNFMPRCAGDTANVFVTSVSGGNGASYSYSINNGGSIPIANSIPLKAGAYQLTIFDRKGCALDTTITVTDPTRFNVDFGPDKTIRLGDSLVITVVGNSPLSKVNWQDLGEVNCLNADCSLISVSPSRSTVFSGTAIDQSGCKATNEIAITVDQRRSVFIPNAFRPDQLSANQDFRFFSGSGVIAIREGRIFNRWGDLVSSVQNLGPDPGGVVIWDGRFKGSSAEPGVYVYMIDVEFSDGVRLIYKGDVTLIR